MTVANMTDGPTRLASHVTALRRSAKGVYFGSPPTTNIIIRPTDLHPNLDSIRHSNSLLSSLKRIESILCEGIAFFLLIPSFDSRTVNSPLKITKSRPNSLEMVCSSPIKRSALGSISSILNTTPKTPTRQGRVGKSATPRSNGIRQKLAHLFGINKENYDRSPCKTVEEENWKVVENLEIPRRGQQIYHLLVAEKEVITTRDDAVRQESTIADVNVSLTAEETTQQSSTTSAVSRYSPEALHIATLLSNRLRLAAYKVSTQQIHAPFSELALLPTCTDTSVSQAIHRFQESKKLQDQARYFRKHRLSTICRRESRRTRKLTQTTVATTTTNPPAISTTKPQLTRQPSTIMEESSASDQEVGLPSPPDSQPAKTPLDETPSTPAPKRRIRKMRIHKKYNEYNGHLGFSSPPQQAYDPAVEQDYYMEDVDVGAVPSSVLRGVEGLWALGFKA